jgi:hypothetical protein
VLAAGAVRSSCRSPAGGGVVVVAVVLVLGPRPQRQCVGIDISHAQCWRSRCRPLPIGILRLLTTE